ncbi:hypothetical protein [Azospirillum sp.]|uniref:hypothetical protein n=1 Tax=Azospirillum sp. TaxID=34012 RepID=UPI002D56B0A8|nr:hypothetical protein [Azospirillum sp.]HYD71151.1 hypothetical protein [Azospirillum sp.]
MLPRTRPTPLLRTLAALAGAVLAAGCATAPSTPDSDYRRALEAAISAGKCEGPAVQAMWTAYHRWYSVAASMPSYHRGSEADALLQQGEMFHILGCRDVARASFDMVLKRFPGPSYTPQREGATRALAAIDPPLRLNRDPDSHDFPPPRKTWGL